MIIRGGTDTTEIPDKKHRIALHFDGNMLYKAEGVNLSHPGHTWVCMCLTFRVQAGYDQWIVDSPSDTGDVQFRAVTASPTTIRVWGKEHNPPFVPVSYPRGSWVTVFVEWSNIGDRLGSIDVNNGQSITKFICDELDPARVGSDIMIGGRSFGESVLMGMKGDLAALDIYAGDKESTLPDYLKALIINDQMVTSKRKRKMKQLVGEDKRKKKNQSHCDTQSRDITV